jgi:hypothetical protein
MARTDGQLIDPKVLRKLNKRRKKFGTGLKINKQQPDDAK